MDAKLVDARLENWRLVVPSEATSLLVLPASGGAAAAETIDGATVVEPDAEALRSVAGSFEGVVAQDLAAWGAIEGEGAAALLERLAPMTAAGGWLYAAFPNSLIPRKPRGLSLRRALRILRSAGFGDVAVYVALPDHRRPAWLVPVTRKAELNVFLRRMAFAYVPFGPPMVARAAARAMQAGRMVGLAAPHRLRVRLAPAYSIVARRTA
jgi:hypothetical protein